MTGDQELAAFLAARLGEDEAAAKAAGDDEMEWRFDGRANPPRIDGAPWESSFHSGIWNCDDPGDDCWEFRLRGESTGDHIARHDPARVLREVEADRALLAKLRQVEEFGEHLRVDTEILILRQVIAIRAAIWNDHPDYEGWLQ